LDDLWIGLGPYLHAFILTKGVNENFGLDVRADPVIVINEVGLGVGSVRLIQRLAKLLHSSVVNLEAFGRVVGRYVVLGGLEKRIMLQERVLEVIRLYRRNGNVGCDAATAVHGAPAVRKFDFLVGVAAGFRLAVVIV